MAARRRRTRDEDERPVDPALDLWASLEAPRDSAARGAGRASRERVAEAPDATDPPPDATDPPPDAPSAADAAPAGEETLTVPQVAERLAAAVDALFPGPFWLVGEISSLKRHRSGHWYLDLVDDQQADGARRAAVSAKIWRPTVAELFGPRGRLAGLLDPADGVVVRALVQAEYYAPRGQVSFTIRDVDPDWALGNLDRRRREALDRLRREGALEWNKARPLADVPLRVGLVTSDGSAAHHDFMQTIASSGLGLSVLFCDARMQGADTARDVRAALATLAALQPDCICLVRGGGSRLNLSWFDTEDLARAVARCPVPVLTGIGHEIDVSVADAAAHAAFKTPTAVAEFLVARGRDAAAAVEHAARRAADAARRTLSDERSGLVERARAVQHAVSARLADEAGELAGLAERLRGGADRVLVRHGHALARDADRVTRGPQLAALARHAERLGDAARRLGLGARAVLDGGARGLEEAAARARLLDPRGVLARGYAWLRRPDGGSVKDAAGVEAGEDLSATLRDGALDLRVTGVRPDGGPGAAP